MLLTSRTCLQNFYQWIRDPLSIGLTLCANTSTSQIWFCAALNCLGIPGHWHGPRSAYHGIMAGARRIVKYFCRFNKNVACKNIIDKDTFYNNNDGCLKLNYRVSHIEMALMNWPWRIKICKLDLVWRWFWNAKIGNFWVPKPFFKKITSAGFNSLQQKGYQVSVAIWIFDDLFHKKGPVGHFGARDDPIIRISIFDEMRLLRSLRLQMF